MKASTLAEKAASILEMTNEVLSTILLVEPSACTA